MERPSYSSLVTLVMFKKNYDRLEANAFLGSMLYAYSDKDTASNLYAILISLSNEQEQNQ